MRLLLDECVPRRLGRELAGHEVRTVQEQGWRGLRNGELLSRASSDFDVFVTVEQGIPFQQNLIGLDLAIVAMAARSNDIGDLLPLMPRVLEAISAAEPGSFVRVSA